MEVRINMTSLFEAMNRALPPDQAADLAKQLLPGLSSAALMTWKKLALQELKSTSRDYAAGLQIFPAGEGTTEIVLTGMLPNMVENGWPGGDMRAWMLKSAKAKKAKDGSRYLVVPFRHGTPSTSGRNVGREMPRAIHKSAKMLAPTLTSPGGKTIWGERLSLKNAQDKRAAAILETKLKPWHTTSIYTGMVRHEKTYESATQSSYQTFRTISTKKRDPRSWVHPGLPGVKLAERVMRELETNIIQRVIAQVLPGGG